MSNLRIPTIPTHGYVAAVLGAPSPRAAIGQAYIASEPVGIRDREIRARYDSGESIDRLAYCLGMSPDYVSDIVRHQREASR